MIGDFSDILAKFGEWDSWETTKSLILWDFPSICQPGLSPRQPVHNVDVELIKLVVTASTTLQKLIRYSNYLHRTKFILHVCINCNFFFSDKFLAFSGPHNKSRIENG